MLYELLTGRPPFQGATPMDTMVQVLTERPVPPGQRLPDCPPALEAICLKCLEKKPRRRYASAWELAEDLRRFLEGKPTVAVPLRQAGARQGGRLLVLFLILGGLVCAGLLACMAGLPALLLSLTRGPAEAAEQFLDLLKQGQVHEAYLATAAGFRATTSEADFAAKVERLGLTDSPSVSWSTRSIENDEATVAGTLTTRAGAVIPLTVRL